MSLVYLASPYTHARTSMQVWRFEQVCKAAGLLMREGVLVFSPIAHSHPIAAHVDLPTDFTFWAQWCHATLSACQVLAVLLLPDWRTSTGIIAETEKAKSLGIPRVLLQVDASPKEWKRQIDNARESLSTTAVEWKRQIETAATGENQ